MKSNTILKITGAALALAILPLPAFSQGHGRGMPAEARDTIHGLFNAHDQFQREVTLTEEGYISKTTSTDPAAAKLLQSHVKQMEGRMKEGLMVRAWDPAYVEFVNHYDDIDIRITAIENGISIVAVGKTEEARQVARNHAGIISKFIDHGWSEHDKTHAAVFADEEATQGMGVKGGMSGMSCCQKGSQETAMGEACNREGEAGCPMGGNAVDTAAGAMSCCRKAG